MSTTDDKWIFAYQNDLITVDEFRRFGLDIPSVNEHPEQDLYHSQRQRTKSLNSL